MMRILGSGVKMPLDFEGEGGSVCVYVGSSCRAFGSGRLVQQFWFRASNVRHSV